jgi:CHAT domain-containing protein
MRTRVKSGGSSKEAVVVGAPDFDLGDSENDEDSRSGRSRSPAGESEEEPAGSKAERCGLESLRGNLTFERLPATRVEAEQIAEMLGVKAWLNDGALKGRLKEISSPRVLHVATHGFFLENPALSLFEDGFFYVASEDVKTGRLTGIRIENPLLRSGLALAGANVWLRFRQPPAEAENGLLTAEDVLALDLSNTELVVLSACDTGLGDTRLGEGILGLRRAFVLAGVGALVMSLWNVADLATTILMVRFYDNLINGGLRPKDALRKARLYTRDVTVGEIRERWLSDNMIERMAEGGGDPQGELNRLADRPDREQPFRDPFFWGAFICEGDI